MLDQEDYYGGMSDSMQGESSDDAPPEKEGDMEEGETALLPKSFFEGKDLKPGDQFYVEVVREHEGEVEVKYPHDVKEKSGMSDSMDKMDAMASDAGGGGY